MKIDPRSAVHSYEILNKVGTDNNHLSFSGLFRRDLRSRNYSSDRQAPIIRLFAGRIRPAEKLYRRSALDSNTMFVAERLISKIIAICPSADLDPNMQSELETLHEMQADHSFSIANYYFDQFKENGRGLKGSQSRFIEIATKYPHFAKIDEVLVLLGEIFVYDVNYEDAVVELKKLINDFPASITRVSIEADLEMVQTNLRIFQVSQGPQTLETSDGSSKP